MAGLVLCGQLSAQRHISGLVAARHQDPSARRATLPGLQRGIRCGIVSVPSGEAPKREPWHAARLSSPGRADQFQKLSRME
jgi:hypothetical protein